MTTPTTNKVLAETSLYHIVVEKVKSQMTMDGTDSVYAVTNKETGVVEGRAATLPDGLGFMHNLQLMYEKITKEATQLEDPQRLPAEHP